MFDLFKTPNDPQIGVVITVDAMDEKTAIVRNVYSGYRIPDNNVYVANVDGEEVKFFAFTSPWVWNTKSLLYEAIYGEVEKAHQALFFTYPQFIKYCNEHSIKDYKDFKHKFSGGKVTKEGKIKVFFLQTRR